LNLSDILKRVHDAGAVLSVTNGKLVCKAPKGAVSPELAQLIRDNKPALIDLVGHATATTDNPQPGIAPLAADARLALTTAQESLVFRQMLDPDSAFLNLPGAWYLRGPLDRDALSSALRAFYARHDIVRAHVASDDEGSHFVIGPADGLSIRETDMSGDWAPGSEAVLVEYLEARARDHLDLYAGPLFQCEIIRVDAEVHVLFILVNHIVWDGWSFDIFLKELDVEYRAAREGSVPSLPRLPVQYTDYAHWHRNQFDSQAFDRQVQALAEELRDYSMHFELPTDKVRPANFSFEGTTEYFEIPEAVVERVGAVCSRHRITPFMLLMGVFKYVLFRFSGQSDIVIGSHIQNRTQAEIDELVGFFVNTMIVRTQLDGTDAVPEMLSRVRSSCLAGYANRHVPIDSLVRKLALAPDPSNLPLVQVFFSFQDATDRTTQIGNLSCRSVIRKAQNADADFTIWVRNFGDRMDGGFDYRTDLYEPETIASFKKCFLRVLDEIVVGGLESLSAVSLLDDDDIRRQDSLWVRKDEAVPALSVDQFIAEQMRQDPERTAVSFGDRRLTYGELDDRVSIAATVLRNAGIGNGDVVGVHLPRSDELVITLLAILRAGAVYLPLDPGLPADRLGFIAGDAGARLIVSSDETRPDWLDADTRLMSAPTLESCPDASPSAESLAQADQPAYMIYTSGSTGKPKGVVVRHENVVNFLLAMAESPGMTRDDRLLAVTTYSFDISVLEFFLPLSVGAEVVVASSDDVRNGQALADLIAERGITMFQSTPATWRLLLASDWPGAPTMKALCGGEALPADLARDLRPRVGALYNMYGPTETTVWSSVCEIEPARGRKVPLGRPIRNTGLYVLDETHKRLPPGALGELYIGGRGVTSGYHDRPELTEQRFIDSPFAAGDRLYATGDVVRIGGSGELYFEGRADDQVKLRGYRIELGEIENAIQTLESVAQAAVVLSHVSADDQRLVAYIVSAPGHPFSLASLRKAIRKTLPDYMVPQHFVQIETMPLGASGKVNRKALPKADLGLRRAVAEPPQTTAENLVADIWKRVIGVDQVGRTDHFFELGGHSLLAMKVISEVERAAGKRLSAGALMLDNLQQIAASLEPDATEQPADDIAPVRRRRGVLDSIKVWMGR